MDADCHPKDCNYFETALHFYSDDGEWYEEPPSSPAQQLLCDGKELVRLGGEVAGFGAITVFGEKLATASVMVSSNDDLVSVHLADLIADIQKIGNLVPISSRNVVVSL